MGPNLKISGLGYGSKTVLGPPHIDKRLLFSEFCSISSLSCSFEFVWIDGGLVMFPVITLSQLYYSYGCFVVGVVVVVGSIYLSILVMISFPSENLLAPYI